MIGYSVCSGQCESTIFLTAHFFCFGNRCINICRLLSIGGGREAKQHADKQQNGKQTIERFTCCHFMTS